MDLAFVTMIPPNINHCYPDTHFFFLISPATIGYCSTIPRRPFQFLMTVLAAARLEVVVIFFHYHNTWEVINCSPAYSSALCYNSIFLFLTPIEITYGIRRRNLRHVKYST
ncbi:MAG: hypothetical protein WCF03_17055, partial [Nitrososphaeraceae archaeon]